MLEQPALTPPEHRFELAELRRLEAARRLEAIAEAEELTRRHRLEHVDLGDGHLEDRAHPPQRVQHMRGVAVFEPSLEVVRLVEQLLEPQLVHLVDDDEQHLVVLVGTRVLRTQESRRVRGRSCRPRRERGRSWDRHLVEVPLRWWGERRVEVVEQPYGLRSVLRPGYEVLGQFGVEEWELAERVDEPGPQQ